MYFQGIRNGNLKIVPKDLQRYLHDQVNCFSPILLPQDHYFPKLLFTNKLDKSTKCGENLNLQFMEENMKTESKESFTDMKPIPKPNSSVSMSAESEPLCLHSSLPLIHKKPQQPQMPLFKLSFWSVLLTLSPFSSAYCSFTWKEILLTFGSFVIYSASTCSILTQRTNSSHDFAKEIIPC